MTATPSSTGRIYGVGVGPGAADLMTVRADRLIRAARRLAYFRKAGNPGQARRIVDGMAPADAVELPMDYPVTTEIPFADPRYGAMLSAFYADCAGELRRLAEAGEDVVVLCEGDPFFYGSFMHLYVRLKADVSVEVVPAVTGMSAAWTASGVPATWGDDVLTVVPATLPESTLARRAADTDALVVMKVGRHLETVRRALDAAGRLNAAWLVENAAMPEERIRRLADTTDRAAPYFSIVLVHGEGRRP